MKTPKLDLTDTEKILLKNAGIRISEIAHYAADELAMILSTTLHRAKCILAHIEFQSIPSVGPVFAQDLVDMGYFSIAELKEKDGAQLLNETHALKTSLGWWCIMPTTPAAKSNGGTLPVSEKYSARLLVIPKADHKKPGMSGF